MHGDSRVPRGQVFLCGRSQSVSQAVQENRNYEGEDLEGQTEELGLYRVGHRNALTSSAGLQEVTLEGLEEAEALCRETSEKAIS